MKLSSWLMFSFVLWCYGYFKTKITLRSDKILLRPPLIITLLCGYPTSTELPKGVLHAVGVWVQFTGLIMALYGGIASKLSNDFLITVIVIAGSLLSSRVFTSFIVKKYRYDEVL